jgi:phospholipid/cholesterol/gamma-HCH transport system substrate-binding protein
MADARKSAPDTRPDSEGGYTKPLVTKRATRIGKSFTSRNPTPIGAIGLVFILVLLYASFNVDSLPLIGGGTTYSAMFTTSANLKSGDDVRIAGVKAGTISSVSIDRPKGQVKVSFKIKNGWVGNQSIARIKLKTLLGAKYLELDSQGTSSLKAGSTIPISRTEAPFDVYPAFTALSGTIDAINTDNLQKAFKTLAQDFSGTPSSVPKVVNGLSRLSITISSRDAELKTLLSRTKDVTGVLADRSADLQKLLSDGNLLLTELNDRRDAIHSLFLNTETLSAQLTGLVKDNQKTLGPLLDNLNKVLNLLQDNQESLDRGIALLGPFYRVFNNVVGNGRWFDNYIQNLNATGLAGLVLPTAGG